MEKKIFQRLRDKLIVYSSPLQHGPGGFISMRDLAEVIQAIILDIDLEEKKAVCNDGQGCAPLNPLSDATICCNCGQKIVNKDGVWYALNMF